MLSLLSDAFFFTGFPLSGIYNIPTEVERHIFTSLSYQSYFKLKAQCCFHLENFLYKPFTRHLQATVCQDLSNFQFTATDSSWHGEGTSSTIPPKRQLEDTATTTYGQQSCRQTEGKPRRQWRHRTSLQRGPKSKMFATLQNSSCWDRQSTFCWSGLWATDGFFKPFGSDWWQNKQLNSLSHTSEKI